MDLQWYYIVPHFPVFLLFGKYNYHISKHKQCWFVDCSFAVRRTGSKRGEEFTDTASISDIFYWNASWLFLYVNLNLQFLFPPFWKGIKRDSYFKINSNQSRHV